MMDNPYIIEQLKQSQMVLVGLGEEFDAKAFLRQSPEYRNVCDRLKKEELGWLIPAWSEFCADKLGKGRLQPALEKLRLLLEDKNYFIVSVSTNSQIALTSWKENRLVMPCGTILKKQCAGGCHNTPAEVSEADSALLLDIFEKLWKGFSPGEGKALLGVCPECGSPLVLNTVYADHYNESGYLDRWQLYTKWLQGTLNRKLTALELGVGMEFPSVIRWPFEKAVYFNQKAFMYRINENLYQLTEELAGKGCGISQNAIDWLQQL